MSNRHPQETAITEYIESLGSLMRATSTPQCNIDADCLTLRASGGLPTLPATGPLACDLSAQRCEATSSSGSLQCTTRRIDETRNPAEVVAFGTSSALWPGALLRGTTLVEGNLAEQAMERRPVTFSISANVPGSQTVTLPNPTLGSFRNALRDLTRDGADGRAPAFAMSDRIRVENAESLAVALGVSASYANATFGAGFRFGSSERLSRMLVTFVQNYFTVDTEPFISPARAFADSVRVTDIERSFAPTSGPMLYVGSVTYGRRLFVSVTSSSSFEEMQADLSVSYNQTAAPTCTCADVGDAAPGSNTTADAMTARAQCTVTTNGTSRVDKDKLFGGALCASFRRTRFFQNSQFTAFVLGGSADDANGVLTNPTDINAINTYITNGASFSLRNPGQPIAYVLRYLSNNEPAQYGRSTSYTIRECFPTSNRAIAYFLGFKASRAEGGWFNDDAFEAYGDIDVETTCPRTCPLGTARAGQDDGCGGVCPANVDANYPQTTRYRRDMWNATRDAYLDVSTSWPSASTANPPIPYRQTVLPVLTGAYASLTFYIDIRDKGGFLSSGGNFQTYACQIEPGQSIYGLRRCTVMGGGVEIEAAFVVAPCPAGGFCQTLNDSGFRLTN